MVIHILKDGTRLNDITGHVVKIEDAEAVYNLMSNINRGKMNVHIEVKEYAKAI